MNKIFSSISGITKKLKSQNSSKNSEIKKFGVFGGVFTPDVLTILGVIMYPSAWLGSW